MNLIGHTRAGTGSQKVIILHDWFSDCSSYEPLLPYLDEETFSYAFLDLRGYGKSISISGKYSLQEACSDILNLAQILGWEQFHLVGHSMSGMIAQRFAIDHPKLLKSLIAITPVPACALKMNDAIKAFSQTAAQGNDTVAAQIIEFGTGYRLSKKWADFKVKRWRETSLEIARLHYLEMFSQNDFKQEAQGLDVPMLVIYGEYDSENFKQEVMEKEFMQVYPKAELLLCKNAGHYPMQEAPVFIASSIESFIKRHEG